MRLRVRGPARAIGQAQVPADKSISHRAALLAALAEGTTTIQGFLESEDCLATLHAVEACGAEVERSGPGAYRVTGWGARGPREPQDVLDCGNSGTTARLLAGVLASYPVWACLTGDASLRQRPMGRVAEPLRRMGARIEGRDGGARLPLAIQGTACPAAIDYAMPVASAQVKSAVLLAGLRAAGPTTVREPLPTRDHSERMLARFGARVSAADGSVTIAPAALTAATVGIPGDLSSGAFLAVWALAVGGSRMTLEGIGLNPGRTGVLDVLTAMGAPLGIALADEGPAEPWGSVSVAAGGLRGVSVGGRDIPRLVDEVPILAVAAALAEGVTEIRDAAELRVKESDRLAAVARELGTMGAAIEELPDGLRIRGPVRLRPARVASGGDHRIAMALAIAALTAEGETVIEDSACVATSFPGFADTLNSLAGRTVAWEEAS